MVLISKGVRLLQSFQISTQSVRVLYLISTIITSVSSSKSIVIFTQFYSSYIRTIVSYYIYNSTIKCIFSSSYLALKLISSRSLETTRGRGLTLYRARELILLGSILFQILYYSTWNLNYIYYISYKAQSLRIISIYMAVVLIINILVYQSG